IPAAITVITKIDLVQDEDWLNLVKEDIRTFSRATLLEHAPLLAVSAKTGTGLDELKMEMVKLLSRLPARKTNGVPRLPIDRVFTISGFGTIVTGMLIGGSVKTGREVQIYPGELTGKIRGLQTHKQKEESAQPGSRTAINVSGIDARLINRGEVLSLPRKLKATRRLDVFFEMLTGVSNSLSHDDSVKLFCGTAEVLARARILGQEDIRAGQTGWVQLELKQPLAVLKGDRFILRRPSPAETLGGGVIVNPLPEKRHKRFDETVLNALQVALSGSPQENFLNICLSRGAAPLQDLLSSAGLDSQNGKTMINELINQGNLLVLDGDTRQNASETLVASADWLGGIIDQFHKELSAYHRRYPIRLGMPREELQQKSALPVRIFALLLKKFLSENVIKEAKTFLALPEFFVKFEARQQKLINNLLADFEKSPYLPPSVKDCLAQVGPDLYRALLENDRLVEVSPDVVFNPAAYADMLLYIKTETTSEGGLTVADFRDHFNTSRKYALAFLEHLDTIGVTERQGDVRKLKTVNR
ncbi:MAG: SelB C-terminal domain-containing protein, partial [Anaerolineae bacterium]|nr:SelB C-terminal domain-containing protein [Anaerolineae bacterium]